MAKNISKNQWFKDIADNVYLNTAVINNILFIYFIGTSDMKEETQIAVIRNRKLLYDTSYMQNGALKLVNDKLMLANNTFASNPSLSAFPLKNKQLETDFYSPEQLAEMYPDDPTYQITTDELTDETKPVVDPVEDMGVT